MRFFTGQLLNHIASLYNWKGIVDVELDSAKVQSRLRVLWPHLQCVTLTAGRLESKHTPAFKLPPFDLFLLTYGYVNFPLRFNMI